MSDKLFKYSENDPRFTNCRAMKSMNEHNRRVTAAAHDRLCRVGEQRKAQAIQVIHGNSDAALVDPSRWLWSVLERVRHTNGSLKLFSFRLRFGRLLIELQKADGSSQAGTK